jgi:hypothetical protein
MDMECAAMSYDSDVLRVEKLENGYEVEVCDPDLVKANSKPKAVYTDPWKSYAFNTSDEVVVFVTKVLGTLEPDNTDMGTHFQQAIEEDT